MAPTLPNLDLAPELAPTATACFAVGGRLVPIDIEKYLDETTGKFCPWKMVTIVAHSTWLWNALGLKSEHRGMQLPLMQEIKESILRSRGKRKKGMLLDLKGQVMPSLVKVCVRGKELIVENNLQHVRMNLGPLELPPGTVDKSIDVLNWFLEELWGDSREMVVDTEARSSDVPGKSPRTLKSPLHASQEALKAIRVPSCVARRQAQVQVLGQRPAETTSA